MYIHVLYRMHDTQTEPSCVRHFVILHGDNNTKVVFSLEEPPAGICALPTGLLSKCLCISSGYYAERCNWKWGIQQRMQNIMVSTCFVWLLLARRRRESDLALPRRAKGDRRRPLSVLTAPQAWSLSCPALLLMRGSRELQALTCTCTTHL